MSNAELIEQIIDAHNLTPWIAGCVYDHAAGDPETAREWAAFYLPLVTPPLPPAVEAPRVFPFAKA